MNKIRTRFAPSPTGYLHVGSLRTALFAWLLARQNKGQFILRIEDTDKNREVEGSIEHIIKSLKSLGLNYDEGPDINGPYGPYRQSDRLDIYKEWALKLVQKGRAYAEEYSEEEIENFRIEAKKSKEPFLYRNYRPKELKGYTEGKALRFKSDPKDYSYNDLIYGDLKTSKEAIDDFIILKSDGYPTYNFAHIIDDYLMQITHIIRSSEFLASVPKFLNLYEALDIKAPQFATVPAVLGPDGKKKLSKRDNAKDALDYLKEGYLKEALTSFMATLGWNDGTEQEIFSLNELIEKFSIEKVQRSPANFDEKRLIYINGYFIRNLDLDKLYDLSKEFWPKEASGYDDLYKKKVLGLLKERLKYLSELKDLSIFFFRELEINESLIKDNSKLSVLTNKKIIELLSASKETLSKSNFEVEDIKNRLNDLLIKLDQKPAILFSLIRIATTQSPSSPGLFETLNLLGKKETLKRIDRQIAAF